MTGPQPLKTAASPKNSPRPRRHRPTIIIFFSLVILLSLLLARRLAPRSTSQLPFRPEVELNLDNPANWQDYANKKLNFYLRYPKSWKLTEAQPSHWTPGNELLLITSPTDSDFPHSLKGGAFYLTVHQTDQTSSAELIQQALGENGIPTYFENNGLNGVIVFSPNPPLPDTLQKTLFLQNGGDLYELNLIWSQPQSDQEKILSQILRSFNLYEIEKTNPGLTSPQSSASGCSLN